MPLSLGSAFCCLFSVITVFVDQMVEFVQPHPYFDQDLHSLSCGLGFLQYIKVTIYFDKCYILA